ASLSDSATVTGNATFGSPTGSVSFSVCGPLSSASGCASGGTALGGAVAVTGGSQNTATASSASFTPSATGTYCFLAHYSGDPDYLGSSDGTAADECFKVVADADLSVLVSDNLGGAAAVAGGPSFMYTIVVSNSGPSSADGVSVLDAMPAGLSSDAWTAAGTGGARGYSATGSGNINDLAVDMPSGSTVTYSVTAAVSRSASGSLVDTATLSAPVGVSDTNPSNSSTDTDGLSALKLAKSTTATGYSAAGQTITYDYRVTNTGTTTISSIALADNKLPAVSCPQNSLAAGASQTCSGVYTTTQPDVDGGSVTNTATASGSDPYSSTVSSNSSTVTVAESGATSSLSLVKSTATSAFSKAGQTISYGYLVTNTGTTTIANIAVADNKVATVTCPDSSLVPGASETCTGAYSTTQADVDGGSVTNTATANGTGPYNNNPVKSNSSSVTVPATQGPAIAVLKTASVKSYAAPGVKITYSYLVSNTGNVTLSKVGVSDPMSGLSAVSCPTSTLAPAASETCTASYTTTQVDVDRGWLKNTGTATGTSPSAVKASAQSSLTVPAVQAPAIAILKSANITTFKTPGTKITYSYKVTNTGNVTLNPVIVIDYMVRLSAVSCPTSTLPPAASETCTATYTTTQTDVDLGWVKNTGIAIGIFKTWRWAIASSTLTIPAVQAPAIAIAQTANPTSYTKAATKITYSYKVTNTGNMTLNPVSVSDPLGGLSKITCPATTLPPAANETCTATYTTTQADATKGSITSTATATATSPTGTKVSATSTLNIT
ncbi:MAG: hypothetical protein ACLP50_28170, partial [Solirubrobacteraceae bacterium]